MPVSDHEEAYHDAEELFLRYVALRVLVNLARRKMRPRFQIAFDYRQFACLPG